MALAFTEYIFRDVHEEEPGIEQTPGGLNRPKATYQQLNSFLWKSL